MISPIKHHAVCRNYLIRLFRQRGGISKMLKKSEDRLTNLHGSSSRKPVLRLVRLRMGFTAAKSLVSLTEKLMRFVSLNPSYMLASGGRTAIPVGAPQCGQTGARLEMT